MTKLPHDIETIISGIPVPVLLVDQNLWILCANEEAEKFYNASLEGSSLFVYLRQPEAISCIQKAKREAKEVTALISEVHEEFEVTLNLKVKPLRIANQNETILIISFLDLTYIDEAEEMRRDFVANVSHELKSPLTALSGFIETLSTDNWDDKKARKRFLKIMEEEANRMSRLVSNLLSLSKVEVSERLIPTSLVNLTEILDIAQNANRQLLQKRKIRITRNCQFPEITLNGDKDQLVQVFYNLFENAIKYSPEDSEVELTYTIMGNHEGQKHVQIEIKDQGRGFDPIHIPRLTERFYRVDKHRTRGVSGTGLGLAIVKHILNRHRGQISIQTKPGIGSIFSVSLPLKMSQEELKLS